MRQCRIKKGKETRSFPSRNPFTLSSFLFYWLSERYRFLESFAGVIRCDKHLCSFFTLIEGGTSQDGCISILGKLHQFADKNFLFGCWRDVMQYLVLFGSVDTDVFRCAKVANLRIKVMGVNVIDWLLIKSRIYNLIRWTTKKRASFFLFLYSAKSQRTLCLMLQR